MSSLPSDPGSDADATPAGGTHRARRRLLVIGSTAALSAVLLGGLLACSLREQQPVPSGYVPPSSIAQVPAVTATTPSPRSSVAPSLVTARQFEVPRGTARRITITNPDGMVIADAALTPFPALRGLDFSPNRGEASWWQQGRYGAPGQSTQSVVAAHVTYEGQPDVFFNLRRTIVGARLVVTFDSSQSSAYVVTSITHAPKSDVVNSATPVGRQVWSEPGLSVVTCDTTSGHRADGHLAGNVVLFTRRAA